MTPVILHHGLLAPGKIVVGPRTVGSFVGIDRVFAERGYTTMLTQVHPTASIERRASQLKSIVLEHLKNLDGRDTRVVIFAHSMGGLDARYMISQLGMDDKVAAVVTVSTPHRGSPYADWCLRHLSRFKALQLFNAMGLDVGAAADLTGESCARFNEKVKDVQGVKYYSVSAARPFWSVTPLLYQPYRVVFEAEGENDGLVSVKSAKWGEHLETWAADHWHLLNRRFVIEMEHATGDIRPYYGRVIERLEGNGVLLRE
jgi:triacylglycerol lipase